MWGRGVALDRAAAPNVTRRPRLSSHLGQPRLHATPSCQKDMLVMEDESVVLAPGKTSTSPSERANFGPRIIESSFRADTTASSHTIGV